MTKSPTPPAPVLLVEDSRTRVDWFTTNLPEGFRLVHAGSAGLALGILRRDGGHTYAAICLDHDLQHMAIVSGDLGMTGRDVVQAVLDHVSPDVPVLVHSANAAKRPEMEGRLAAAGFDVEVVPFGELKHRGPWLVEWLQEAGELWLDERGVDSDASR